MPKAECALQRTTPVGVGEIKTVFHEANILKQNKDKADKTSAENGVVGGTAQEVGGVGGAEVAVGAVEMTGAGCVDDGSARASAASLSFNTSE